VNGSWHIVPWISSADWTWLFGVQEIHCSTIILSYISYFRTYQFLSPFHHIMQWNFG